MSSDILVKIGADISNFSRGISDATQDLSKMGKATNGLTLGKLVGAVGVTAALSKGFNMVKDSVGRAFGRIDTMEQFDRVMTTMTGSSKKAESVLNEVNDTVKGTAYGLDVGAKAVQGFVTSNMDVDKATATFKSWGDAVAFYGDGTSETLGSVTDALAKATAKGKIQMDTMNILAENGIPAMQIYADATGKSVEDVAKMMEKGQIKADEFHKVMNDAMKNGTKNFKSIDGAAKEAGASWTGSFDNMKAAVARGVIAIIENIDEMLTSNGLPDMRTMVAEFGSKFEDVLKKAAESIPIVVEKLKEVYNTLEPWMPLMGAVASAVAGMVAAWSAFNTVKNVIDNVKTSFKLLNGVMMKNPWLLVIGAVILAAVLIYKYWEPISEFFKGLWEKIKIAGLVIWETLKHAWKTASKFVTKVWDSVSDFFSNLWNGIKEKAINIWEGIVESVTDVYEKIKSVFEPMVTFFGDTFEKAVKIGSDVFGRLGDFLSNTWDNIKTIAESAWEIIKNIILGPILLLIDLVTGDMEGFKENLKAIWNNISEAAGKIWTAIKDIVVEYIKMIWENAKEIFQGLVDTIKDYLTSLEEAFNNAMDIIYEILANAWSFIDGLWRDALSLILGDSINKFGEIKHAIEDAMESVWIIVETIWNFVKKTFSNAIGIIKALVDGDFKKIKEIIKNQMTLAKNTLGTIWENVKRIFSRVLAALWGIVKEKFNQIKNAAKEKMEEAKRNIENAWNKAVEFLKSIDLMQIGKDVIEGFIKGIKSKVKAVGDAAKEAADAVTGKIKAILGIKSPSRVLAQIGRWTGEGLAKGIVQTTNLVGRATAKLAEAATPDAPAISLAYDTPSGIRSNLSSAVNGTVDVNARDDMIAEAIDNLSRKLENMRIEMDRREMGRFVSDVTTEDRNSAVRGRGHRRING